MTKYIITTESGSDLPKDLQEKYNIHIVPMHVTMGEETYDDGSFDVEEVFNYYDRNNVLPKTSGSTPEDNTKVFREIFDQYPDANIIHIAYSAVTTVSYNAANIAAEEFDNIHLVDAKHVSMGLTTVIQATAEFIEDHPDTTPEEIIAFVEDIRERTKMVFLPKTLIYLKAGGRVSSLAYHGANLLNLHPTIKLEDGYLVSGKKYRGSFERCLRKMFDDFFKEFDIDRGTVLVGGAPDITKEQKEDIFNLLREYGVEDSKWVEAGAVISSHGGPGAVGLAGIEK
ncbi:MAG TPA: DegV family protein [Atopostipes sp.]|nr:DegV family protein [Atopostipes sp.]